MKTRVVELLAIALLTLTGQAAAGSGDSLAGTWSLDDRSSDDPVDAIEGKHGNGLGRQIVKSVNIFGIPVGSLPLPGDDEGEKEDPPTPAQIVGASLAYVFEATYRLRITQNDSATEIRYGNAPANVYRDGVMFEHDGWTSKVELRNGALAIEHERQADGAHISERYWVEPRADELRWTATLKRPKKGTVEVKRVFYRAPANQDANLPLTAQLSP
jgi:hypothetical protein